MSNHRENCLKCRRAQAACICHSLSPIKTNTRFVILMHPMEAKKIKNGTGRISHLQLENSEIIVDIDFSENKSVNKIISNSNNQCFILYPGKLSSCIEEDPGSFHTKEKNNVFFLIDATWPCAKKMLKLSKNLQGVRKISFNRKYDSEFHIKQQPSIECLSTIESIHNLLINMKNVNLENIAENELSSFLNPFREIVQYQIKCALDPKKNKYRSGEQTKITRKTNYKTKPMTDIFFNGHYS